jgi:hypothetical protein
VLLCSENKIEIDLAITYGDVSVPVEEFTLFVLSDRWRAFAGCLKLDFV